MKTETKLRRELSATKKAYEAAIKRLKQKNKETEWRLANYRKVMLGTLEPRTMRIIQLMHREGISISFVRGRGRPRKN